MNYKSKSPKFLWVLILGAVGFCVGFFGTMILVPEANQGPLLGIFVTGPLGVAVGFVFFGLCTLFSVSAETQWRGLKVCAVLFVVVTVFFIFPEPLLRGEVIQVRIEKCRTPADALNETIEDWNKRIAGATGASPRVGWQEEMQRSLNGDQGVVLDTIVMQKNEMRENRKPWNKGQITASGWETVNEKKSFYLPANSAHCADFKTGDQLSYFIDRNFEIKAPKEWPPLEVESFIPFTKPLPVPQEFNKF
jgi:hypothetical protein